MRTTSGARSMLSKVYLVGDASLECKYLKASQPFVPTDLEEFLDCSARSWASGPRSAQLPIPQPANIEAEGA